MLPTCFPSTPHPQAPTQINKKDCSLCEVHTTPVMFTKKHWNLLDDNSYICLYHSILPMTTNCNFICFHQNVWQEQQNKNHTRTMMTLTQPPSRNKTEEELIIWDVIIPHSHWSQTYLCLCWSSLHFAGDSGNDRCHQSGRAWSCVHTSHDVCGPAAGCLHHATIGEACPGTRWWSASHQFGRARPLHQRHTADDLKESRALMTGKKEKRSSRGWVVPSLVFSGMSLCPILLGAGTAQWLECWTHDWKVAGSNPCRSGARIFFSKVDFLC